MDFKDKSKKDDKSVEDKSSKPNPFEAKGSEEDKSSKPNPFEDKGSDDKSSEKETPEAKEKSPEAKEKSPEDESAPDENAGDIYIALSHNANQPKAEGEVEEFKKWVTHVGGQHVESNSMDDIFSVPSQNLSEIKDIHQKYMDHFGVGINVGVGSSADEAHEALLAGEEKQQHCVNFSDSLDQPSCEQAEGEQPQAPQAEGEQAEGEQAEGEQPQAPQAEGEQAEGEQPQAPQAEGEQAEGEQPQAPQAEGEQPIATGSDQPDQQEQNQTEAETANNQPSEVDHMYNMYQANSEESGQQNLDQQSAEQSKQYIKQKITEVLSVFKDNKNILDQAQQSSPELHSAVLQMLRTMIDLGKVSLYDKKPEKIVEQDKMAPSAEKPM